MTPATTDLIRAIEADRQVGTPGPWGMETKRTSCGVCHQIGPWPHAWRHGKDMSACIYDDYPSPPQGTDAMLANARRIARLPDVEDALIAAQAEIAKLRAALRWAHDTLWEINPDNCDYADICNLNDASVEVILGIAPLIGETHGKSPEWWAAVHGEKA